ncbi:TraI/MobA(P) family conjugative relaxase [Serratia ureilytica]|uniref:TraI/MobA(P) family conjugative relaxase n=1 Tax=Serratia ureilytica TaxID=300181 RepID=UPI0025511175|nr:TraI/MobA(P) family conjugative relaxase [Serratia ureilytica]
MIPIVPEKRRDGRSSFIQLVSYLTLRDEDKPDLPISPENPYVRPSRSKAAIFDRLVGYLDRNAGGDQQTLLAMFADGTQQVKSGEVVCETNCFSLETASAEMNTVAMQNTRCVDPVYHCILSWREEDTPTDQQIFESARYCINQLGMADHQYVFAVHRDTDNVHCHIAVNRIHPESYRAANMYKDVDTLHKACRHLELKHGFTPDNGAWKVNDQQQVVRSQNDFKSIPRKARQLEYYADSESLFSYAVGECRQAIGDIMADPERLSWLNLHNELNRAGLVMKQKGEGLAIYSIQDSSLPPIKASSLHPDLTRSCMEPYLGEFTSTLDVDAVASPKQPEYVYDPRFHARDLMARVERRQARAEAREDLKARYQAYKSAWVRPKLDADVIKARYRNLSQRFAWRKAKARVELRDPLLRKLTYHIIEVERMKAMAALRLAIKEERQAFKAAPENRRLSYREWVEQQALMHDQAAIAQLRGWSYRLKRSSLTSSVSLNGIRFAVSDDSKPLAIDGYQTRIMRDGVVQYVQNGVVQLQDRGERIEVADPHVEDGQHIITGLVIAQSKSGEEMVLEGDRQYVQQSCELVSWFNEASGTSLPLTETSQRTLAGYGSLPTENSHGTTDASVNERHELDGYIQRPTGPRPH